jgi:Flp pilus assembly protein TadD
VRDETRFEAYHAFQEGTHLLETSNTHAACVALERARRLEPEQGSIREALARAYYRCGRFDAARLEFAKAVEIDPVNDYAHFGLGLSLLRSGDDAGARRHLRLATVMAPERAHYREALHAALERVEPPGSEEGGATAGSGAGHAGSPDDADPAAG